jgi:hypothetical protein
LFAILQLISLMDAKFWARHTLCWGWQHRSSPPCWRPRTWCLPRSCGSAAREGGRAPFLAPRFPAIFSPSYTSGGKFKIQVAGNPYAKNLQHFLRFLTFCWLSLLFPYLCKEFLGLFSIVSTLIREKFFLI